MLERGARALTSFPAGCRVRLHPSQAIRSDGGQIYLASSLPLFPQLPCPFLVATSSAFEHVLPEVALPITEPSALVNFFITQRFFAVDDSFRVCSYQTDALRASNLPSSLCSSLPPRSKQQLNPGICAKEPRGLAAAHKFRFQLLTLTLGPGPIKLPDIPSGT